MSSFSKPLGTIEPATIGTRACWQCRCPTAHFPAARHCGALPTVEATGNPVSPTYLANFVATQGLGKDHAQVLAQKEKIIEKGELKQQLG